MVFGGLFNDLKLEEVVAVLIALVHQEKNNEAEFDSELPENLLSCCKRMQTIATNLG
jgi:superfamily II RNA helicase